MTSIIIPSIFRSCTAPTRWRGTKGRDLFCLRGHMGCPTCSPGLVTRICPYCRGAMFSGESPLVTIVLQTVRHR